MDQPLTPDEERIARAIRARPHLSNSVIGKNLSKRATAAEVERVRQKLTFPSQKAVTLAEFRAMHDPDTVLETKIKETLEGDPDKVFEDEDFRMICGLSRPTWKNVTSRAKWKPWRYQSNRLNVWASEAAIREITSYLGA